MPKHGTGIEWTHFPGYIGATWNPVTGCRRVSEGCRYCYAERQSKRNEAMGVEQYQGLLDEQGRWNGTFRFVESALDKPLRWRHPHAVFVNSMSDLFGEGVKDEWIDKVFAVMALCPQHRFLILTKRPERMQEYFTVKDGTNVESYAECRQILEASSIAMSRGITGAYLEGFETISLTNVALGFSAENQDTFDERWAAFKGMHAALTFVSIEPMLGPIVIPQDALELIDWFILGGESGPKARAMDPEWARAVRNQVKKAGKPFFFKQWGEWRPAEMLDDWIREFDPDHLHIWSDPICRPPSVRVGKKRAGNLLDGVVHAEFPMDFVGTPTDG